MGYEQNNNNPVDDTLDRLVAMTNQTCLAALDKTITTVHNTKKYPGYSLASAASRCGFIADRMNRCVIEVGNTVVIQTSEPLPTSARDTWDMFNGR